MDAHGKGEQHAQGVTLEGVPGQRGRDGLGKASGRIRGAVAAVVGWWDGKIRGRVTLTTRHVVYAAIVGALYFVLVVGLAPISFHVLQFRAANVLKGLAICRPEFAFGFALGDFFANQASPFGVLDWGVMPFFDVGGALLAYVLRKRKWLAVGVQSAVIAVGVATFPLGLGAGLPWLFSFVSVFASSVLVIGVGTVMLVPAWEAVVTTWGIE